MEPIALEIDHSKIKNQDIKLSKTSVDIHVITDIVKDLSQPMISSTKLKIINKVDPKIPLVYADENRVQQILMNIIGNAIKFTTEGRITVKAKEIYLNNNENFIEISISDTGIGIPSEKYNTIFEKFEQVLVGSLLGDCFLRSKR